MSKFKNGSIRVRNDETDTIFDLQGWMIDPVFCREIREVEKPYASIKALLEMAELVSHLRSSRHSKMGVFQAKEYTDEQSIDAPSHGEEPGQGFRERGCGGFEESSAGKLEGREA